MKKLLLLIFLNIFNLQANICEGLMSDTKNIAHQIFVAKLEIHKGQSILEMAEETRKNKWTKRLTRRTRKAMSGVQAKVDWLNIKLKSLTQERINMALAISSECTSNFVEELKCVQKNMNMIKQVHALEFHADNSELKTTFGRNLDPGNCILLKNQLKNAIN